MTELIAQGADASNSWQHALLPTPVTLGREASKSQWAVPWDREISGLHATLHWHDGKLSVRREPTARNRIYYHGQPTEEFVLEPGDHFVIGKTRFELRERESTILTDPLTPNSELTCSRQELEKVKYPDATERIEALAALPKLIHESRSDKDLDDDVLEILLQGISRAEAVGLLVGCDEAGGGPELRAVNFRAGAKKSPFPTSQRLITEAFRRRQSCLHSWTTGQLRPDYTPAAGFDWALCTPLLSAPSPGWAFYVVGKLLWDVTQQDSTALQALRLGDLKFTELVAAIFESLQQVRDLQRRQALLTRFFSRPVLAAMANRDIAEFLKPRETEVTVLFCDLRSSCRIHETGQDDLHRLWRRVGAALDLMATCILDQDGVIGDFQGDAAMGFWGWPFANPNQVEQCARAALAIQRRLATARNQADNPLAGFQCGIGIAHGRAIAGRLGTLDQFKIDVFGPVVNLAARLESLTKHFDVRILLDEQAAKHLQMNRDVTWARCRRLARVQPYGMSQVNLLSELLPSAVEPNAMPEPQRRDYEAALDAFMDGRWTDARRLLQRLPHDRAASVLLRHLDSYPDGPPPAWNGVIVMESK
jgi:adenylate cyclase